MAVDSSPLPQDTLWKLRQAETTLPRTAGGYEGNTFTDLNTVPVFVNGQRFLPIASKDREPPNQIVKGWQRDMGGGTWYGYDLDGKFTGNWYADNSWQQFIEAATLPALAYGVNAAGVTGGMGLETAAGAWESGTLASGVTVGGPMGAGAAGLTATELAPWAATAAAGGGAAATASSLSTLGKGVASLAAATGGMTAKPGQASTVAPSILKQQPPGTPGTIAGFPVELVLIVGAVIAAAMS